MTWEEGRLKTGYRKKKLAAGKNWDCWLIDYPEGAYLVPHLDKVEGKRHYRFNIRLRGADLFEGETIFRWWRFVFFRPDIMLHSVKNFEALRFKNRRIDKRRSILSIGWTLDERH